MTLSPNTQITQANVGLLKAGDWLMPLDDRLGTAFESGVAVEFVKASDNGKLLRVSGDTFGPHNWFSSDRFTYHRPALSPPAEVPFAAEDACLACKSPAPVDWERVGPKLVEAAQRYFDGYCQDEAAEDALQWVGCSQEQHEAAVALKDALAAAQPEGL